jgi:hypothetical protein
MFHEKKGEMQDRFNSFYNKVAELHTMLLNTLVGRFNEVLERLEEIRSNDPPSEIWELSEEQMQALVTCEFKSPVDFLNLLE